MPSAEPEFIVVDSQEEMQRVVAEAEARNAEIEQLSERIRYLAAKERLIRKAIDEYLRKSLGG